MILRELRSSRRKPALFNPTGQNQSGLTPAATRFAVPMRVAGDTATARFPLWRAAILAGLWLLLAPFTLCAAESWQAALDRMQLGTNVTQLNLTNCVALMLPALQSNQTVKALIFMPGATDEFYFFHRAKAELTNASPTLLDAVNALTQQTHIRATFRPPMLLLHTAEDPLEPVMIIKHRPTADWLKRTRFLPHVVYEDRDWDFLQPILEQELKRKFRPEPYSMDSWHFYRHSFAAWDLNGWEALEAIALAGKTKSSIHRGLVNFEGDERKR